MLPSDKFRRYPTRAQAAELDIMLGVFCDLDNAAQYRTCLHLLHLLHRLRAMLAGGEKLPLAGIVEADETYVGGKAKNRQKHREAPVRGRGTAKPMLFAALERGGSARTAVIPSASVLAIDPLLFSWVDRDGVLCTDELAVYDCFGRKKRRHLRVQQNIGEYARTESGTRAHVNELWSILVFGIRRRPAPRSLEPVRRRGSGRPR
jgi:hypothetical protein